jgi:hypothetical protein
LTFRSARSTGLPPTFLFQVAVDGVGLLHGEFVFGALGLVAEDAKFVPPCGVSPLLIRHGPEVLVDGTGMARQHGVNRAVGVDDAEDVDPFPGAAGFGAYP